MTYYNTAAARHAIKRYAAVTIISSVGATLAGCGANNGGIGAGGGLAAAGNAAQTPPAQQAARAKIAIAPIIGAPGNVSRQLTASLNQAITAQRVAVSTTKGETVDYTLRGYVVAAKEAGATKLSYIWDVTNPAGTRVNRITGEQTIRGSSSKDPWVAVSPAVVQTIADKTASSFGTWLPAKTAQPAVATNSNTQGAAAAARKTTAALQPAALKPRPTGSTVPTAARIAPKPQLAALKPAARPGPVMAVVPNVTGAPGDGRVSLSAAIRRELQRNGVKLTNTPSPSAYEIVGNVAVGAAKAGKQPIKIDWHVKDPKGNSLGTVSQNNKIPQGSLDGTWGKTADAAAGAAAQGILKLLPKSTAVN